MDEVNVKNKELFDSLLSLTKKMLEIVSNRPDNELVLIDKFEWVEQDDSSFIKQISTQPLRAKLLYDNKEKIQKTNEYLEFLKVLKSDSIISKQLDKFVGAPLLGSFPLQAFDIGFWSIRECLKDKDVSGFDITKFNSTYKKIENDLYSNEIEYLRITPLFGLSMEQDEIQLTDNISLVKLEDEELLDFFDLEINLGAIARGYDFIKRIHRYAIKVSYNLPKIIGDECEVNKYTKIIDELEGNKIEQHVLSMLRIFKEGKILPIANLTKGNNSFAIGKMYRLENSINTFTTDSYILSNTESAEFKRFWKQKSKVNITNKSFLSVAIRRFSNSADRDSIEDRIIDLMISAEAIFLSSGGNYQGELKYRLAHRASLFLDTEVKKQQYIFWFMQKAYDIRSSIVHGSQLKLPKKHDGTKYSVEEIHSEIESYIREAIKKVIQLLSENPESSNKIDWNSIIFPLSDDVDC